MFIHGHSTNSQVEISWIDSSKVWCLGFWRHSLCAAAPVCFSQSIRPDWSQLVQNCQVHCQVHLVHFSNLWNVARSPLEWLTYSILRNLCQNLLLGSVCSLSFTQLEWAHRMLPAHWHGSMRGESLLIPRVETYSDIFRPFRNAAKGDTMRPMIRPNEHTSFRFLHFFVFWWLFLFQCCHMLLQPCSKLGAWLFGRQVANPTAKLILKQLAKSGSPKMRNDGRLPMAKGSCTKSVLLSLLDASRTTWTWNWTASHSRASFSAPARGSKVVSRI